MAGNFSVELEKIIKEFKLEIIYTPKDPKEILITSADINRPGLELCGYFDFFDSSRIQVMGKSEYAYLGKFDNQQLAECLDAYFSHRPPAIIITRNLPILPQIISTAKKYEIALLLCGERTSEFMSGLIASLNLALAPRVTRHGVLVEVYGEGILLLGESGVGKSETAIELVKRGHRLIADDAVEIKRVSNKTLIGSSPENIRHFLELRGVGIINARRLFGIGSVNVTEKLDLIIFMEQWDQNKMYDRMGLDSEYTDILGISVPSITIPVKPGRNLAIIIEVAAMNNRQKKMGYNSALELLKKLGMLDDVEDAALNNTNEGAEWSGF